MLQWADGGSSNPADSKGPHGGGNNGPNSRPVCDRHIRTCQHIRTHDSRAGTYRRLSPDPGHDRRGTGPSLLAVLAEGYNPFYPRCLCRRPSFNIPSIPNPIPLPDDRIGARRLRRSPTGEIRSDRGKQEATKTRLRGKIACVSRRRSPVSLALASMPDGARPQASRPECRCVRSQA